MKTLKSFVLLSLIAVFITACGAGGGGDTNTNNPGASDITKPTVSQTSPANGATGVAVNSAISVTFSEAVDSTSVTSSTFQVAGVTGTVSVNGTTATFTPSSNLGYNTAYTITLTTGIKDAAGNTMGANYTCGFTTGTLADTTPPTVSSVSPANNATDMAVNASVTATFSETMDASTINDTTFTLKQGATPVSGAVTYSGTTATFTPSSSLSYSTTYTATIATGAKDTAGNAMTSNYSWSFTTGVAPDTTPPTISSTSPANNATGIAVNSAITATFSETMDVSTITTSTFTLKQGTTPVSGAVTYSSTTATFTPSSNLSYSTSYTATITTGAKDTAGNAMASDYSWSFITGNVADTTAPTNTTASNFISSGASSTSSTSVTLAVSSTDAVGVTAYFASESSTAPYASASVWTAITSTTSYSASVSFTLSSGGGTKTVYVWFKDSAGNVSAAASDTIILSTDTVSLPKTGQTTSYATGDDGDLEKGVAWPDPRFTVGTGTEAECVTDNLTGLMWVKSPDSTTRTWADALTYADGLSLCGYTDWRLPNVNELESLTNAEQANSATWLNTQGFSNVQDGFYWSSTTYASNTAVAWLVSSYPAAYFKTVNVYVWPVRAGQATATTDLPKTGQTISYATGDDGDLEKGVAWPDPKFTVGTGAEADCVTDNLTGLM